MVAIGQYEFHSQVDAGAFVAKAFPHGEEVYECFMSASLGYHPASQSGVTDLATLQADKTHEHRVKRGERKTQAIASFQTKYPATLAALGNKVSFSELKMVQNWTNLEKDGFTGLLEETIRNERGEFHGYLMMVFETHPVAYDFCHKLFEHACDWMI